jgi:hypothetical protein
MCASTIVQLRMGTVAYAAADPLFDGMQDWFADLPFAAARRPERTVLGGPVGTFCHVLHLSWLAFWQPTGPTIDAHARLTPRELEVARAIAAEGHLACIEGTAVDALEAVWELVV